MVSPSKAFGTAARQCTKHKISMSKLSILVFTMLLMMISPSGTAPVHEASSRSPVSLDNTFEPASNLIKVKLPYSVNSIAAGTIPLGSGLAYIHEETIRFKDPVNLLNDSEPIGIGAVYDHTLKGADIDGDGYTEFLFIKDDFLVLVDFDSSSVLEFLSNVPGAMEIVVGDFEGDSRSEAAVYNNDIVRVMNLTDGNEIGSFNPLTDIRRVCCGNYSADEKLQIAILSNDWAFQRANIDIIAGNGTLLKSTSTANQITGVDLTKFSLSNDLDNIAITTIDQGMGPSNNVLIGYFANLTQKFFTKIPGEFGETYVKPGNFNGDTIEDLAVVPGMSSFVWFVEGDNGSLLRSSKEECTGMYYFMFDTAILDSDTFADLAIEGPRGQLSLVRGSNGETGYEEHRLPGPFYQILAYDVDADGREDIITLTGEISILLSDKEPPEVNLDPLYPSHPTIYDSYFKVELTANDNLAVERATIYIQPAGAGVTAPFTPNEMIRAPNNKYLYITTDLQAGDFYYYIEVVDAYLNSFSYGNSTNPQILTVEDHFANGHFFNATIEHARGHVLAMGNNTSGDELVQIITIEYTARIGTLRVFHPNGTNVANFSIPSITQNDRFEVYTGMHDGDNILDPVISAYNKSHTRFWVLHGNDLTSWKNVTYKLAPAYPYSPILMFDDDEDDLDEIHYVAGNETDLKLIRVEHDYSSQIESSLSGNEPIVGIAYATISGTRPQLAILRENNTVGIYQADDLSWLKTLDYSSPGSTLGDEPLDIIAFYNSSHLSEQFMAVYRGWSGDTPINYLCFIDDQTQQVGDTPFYEMTNYHVEMVLPHDFDSNGIDELLIFEESGNLSLHDLSNAQPKQWTVFVSEAIPLSSVVLDYDGDGEKEFVISTSDDLLTALSFKGKREYQALVGMTFNMVPVHNVDVCAGEDIGAFPIFRTRYTAGIIRNIDLLYELNATFILETNTTLQGTNVWANTTVFNAYDESVYDATVSLVAEYAFAGGASQQVLGLIYDNPLQKYTTIIAPNWPIGMVNLTLNIDHQYYKPLTEYYPNAIRVESPLSVFVFTYSEVLQGDALEVNITVTDSLGGKVTNANVTVILDAAEYTATHIGQFYFISISNITLAPGSHNLFVSADHPYATGVANQMASFSVLAWELDISRSSPVVAEQDKIFLTWLNITDLYDNPISNAEVYIDFGITEFLLIQVEPGRYLLNTSASLPIGNYTAKIFVHHPFVEGSAFGEYYMGVTGDLSLDVSYDSTVEGGENFTVSISIHDAYGPVSGGSWAKIEINGQNFTAIHVTGAKFSVEANASYGAGPHIFTVYAGATLGYSTSATYDISVYSSPYVMMKSSLGWNVNQGDTTTITLTLRDWSGNLVPGALVTALSPSSLAFQDHANGTYSVELQTLGLSPGNYSIIVSVSHDYLYTEQFGSDIVIIGIAIVEPSIPMLVLNYQETTLNFTVTDQFGNPLSSFDYMINLGGKFNISGSSSNYRFSWILIPEVVPGSYKLSFTISGIGIDPDSFEWDVEIRSKLVATVLSPMPDDSHVQGEDQISFLIELADYIDNPILGGSVSVIIYDATVVLEDLNDGTYSALVSTLGWPSGTHNYTVLVRHSYQDHDFEVRGTAKVVATLAFKVSFSPTELYQGEQLDVTVRVEDKYGNGMTGLQVDVTFQNISKTAEEISIPGEYVVSFDVKPEGYGEFNITVAAEGATCLSDSWDQEVTVDVAPPQISLNTDALIVGSGLSFLISFIGLLIYFRVSTSLSVTEATHETMMRSVRKMDILYLIIVGLTGLTLLHSYISAAAGDFALALVESVLLLGIAVLLYGLWLYRDASYSVLHRLSISRKRMVLGLWHLIFVPLVIIQIFEWGSQIDWFEVYVLQETFNLADFAIPTIMLTIFVTYVSSIVIVVVNLYREISKGLSRLTHMAEMGTPPVVVDEECVQLVKKMGSSIRIKFFMFLVILAGTTALTMDFLRSYSLGVIVLMPVVLLVIVPYVSSKMAKGVSKASEIMRTRREADSVALQSIADEDIEVVSPIEKTLEEADKQPLEDAGEYESEASIEPDSIGAALIPKRTLTKKELIDLIPPEVKDSVDPKELKKLSKKALEALIQPRDEDDAVEEQ